MARDERMQEAFDFAAKLLEIIRSMQQRMQCKICLHIPSDPTLPPCGHQDGPTKENINKLNNLIKAIQQDSGIDLLLSLARPPRKQKAAVPKISSIEEIPSCSYINDSLEKRLLILRANQKHNSRNVPEEKRKMGQGNNKDLSNCCMSGVEPLAPDKLTEYYESDKSTQDKVQNWLKSLSNNEILDANRDMSILSTGDDFYNAVTRSVTQNLDNNKTESLDLDEIKTVIVDMKTLTGEESGKNESKDKKDNGKSETGAFTKYIMERYDFDESPRPCALGMKPSSDDVKDKKQEAHRTVLKDNWTSVVQLGKKMRTRKRKFKALDVSVENAKSRLLDDAKRTETGESREIDCRGRERRQDRCDTSEEKPRNVCQKKVCSLRKQSVVPEESSRRETDAASVGGNEQHNASYMTLEGERVHIDNLNDKQVSDIIGITPSDKGFASDSSSDTVIMDRGDWNPSNELRRTTSSSTLAYGTMLEKSVLKTLSPHTSEESQTVKRDLRRQIDHDEGNSNTKKKYTKNRSNESPDANVVSHLQTAKLDLNCQIDQNKGNTNAKKRSIERKSNESPVANVDSHLKIVKSDLSCQIDQTKVNPGVKKRHTIEGKRSVEIDKENRGLVRNRSCDYASKNKRQNGPVVTFKKLGKIFKQFKKNVCYSYLGSIKKEATMRCIYGTENVWKNFLTDNFDIIQLDTGISTRSADSTKGFGNKNIITVNNTPIAEQVGNIVAVKETKNVETKESVKYTEACILKKSTNVPGKSQNADVLVICLEDSEGSKETQNRATSPVVEVRMFSPMDDSQLQFLSLGSPVTEYKNVKATNPSDSPKKSNIETEEKYASSSSSQIYPISSFRKRKRLNSGDTSPETSKPCEQTKSNLSNKVSALNDNSNNSALTCGKKQYRKILPLDSDSSSPVVVPINELVDDEPTTSNKRKRRILSDSDSEMDLKMTENWCTVASSLRCNEKREVSGSSKASCEVKGKSTFTNCSKTSNKPSKLAQEAGVSAYNNKKSNPGGLQHERTRGNETKEPDEDSPDFGSMIDKMKDIKSKGVVSELKTTQYFTHNFDDVFADVNTVDLVMDCSEEMYEENDKETEPVCKKKTSFGECSNANNSSDKENNFTTSVNEIEKSKKNTIQVNASPVASTSKASMEARGNKSLRQNESVKDPFENDSFMNVTEDYLMLQQFEDDLLGGAITKRTPGWEPSTPKKLKNNQKSSTNLKIQDIEHVVEDNDDDIIEGTPEAHGRKYSKSPSTVGKSSNFSTPNSKRIQPLGQSTPRTPQSTSSTIRRFTSTAINKCRDIDLSKWRKKLVNVENELSDRKQVLCFTCSGLITSQVELVHKLAQRYNARCVSQFEPEVTHVIVKTNQNNGANKTLKYLQGIAHRKWIVSYQWVLDSVKEGRLMNEESYEAVDCRTLEAGPRKSRTSDEGLFKSFAFLCIGPYTNVSVKQYEDLLRAAGARVVGSLAALAAETKLKIIVVQADIYEIEIIKWHKETKAISVDHEWIVECISQYKLVSLYPYLQELSRPDALAAGYPEYLLEEDPDCDDTSMSNDN